MYCLKFSVYVIEAAFSGITLLLSLVQGNKPVQKFKDGEHDIPTSLLSFLKKKVW